MTKSRLKTIAVVAGICLLGAGIAAGNVKQTDENPTPNRLQTDADLYHDSLGNRCETGYESIYDPNTNRRNCVANVPEYLTQDQHESGLIGVGKATQTVTETDDNPTGK